VKLGGGDRCGATRGTDWREGEERRARCGEAEVGVHFIGPGGDEASGGGVLIPIGFK
jgi:hypothetical protein